IGTTRAPRRRQLPTKRCHAALLFGATRAYQPDSSSKPLHRQPRAGVLWKSSMPTREILGRQHRPRDRGCRHKPLDGWSFHISYKDLVRLDESMEYDRPSLITFLFRGHARSNWRLVPSLVRQVARCDMSASEALAVERSARLEFSRQAHLHLPAMLLAERDDAMSWWLTMQHYNAPTRLLDWTRSLFVAAYFAVEKDGESDGVIWILHAPRMLHETRRRFGLELPE